jgi:sporulation protein YlmC with PRC-barrel domain
MKCRSVREIVRAERIRGWNLDYVGMLTQAQVRLAHAGNPRTRLRSRMEVGMKPIRTLMLAGLALTAPAISHAQVAGSTTVGVSVSELRDVTLGWSAKRTILGQPVYNEKNERVGSIDDIVISPDKAVSYAIVNAGGFLGLAKHDVAIPVSQLKLVDNNLVLAGATKDSLKA